MADGTGQPLMEMEELWHAEQDRLSYQSFSEYNNFCLVGGLVLRQQSYLFQPVTFEVIVCAFGSEKANW